MIHLFWNEGSFASIKVQSRTVILDGELYYKILIYDLPLFLVSENKYFFHLSIWSYVIFLCSDRHLRNPIDKKGQFQGTFQPSLLSLIFQILIILIGAYVKCDLWWRPFWISLLTKTQIKFANEHPMIIHVQFGFNQMYNFFEINKNFCKAQC